MSEGHRKFPSDKVALDALYGLMHRPKNPTWRTRTDLPERSERTVEELAVFGPFQFPPDPLRDAYKGQTGVNFTDEHITGKAMEELGFDPNLRSEDVFFLG